MPPQDQDKVEPLVENGGWNSAHLRQNEQDRDKLLAPVQEINHLLEELEREATAAQPVTRAAFPSHHPLIVRAFLFVGVCNYGM
jgi:hypothetical protein